MTSSPSEPPTGLRERKKAKTRASLQEHALRLFREQGYAETTTEQIASAAEVSPSTFFRYFRTKEETVLYDPIDPVLFDAFLRQPADATPIQALRAAIRAVSTELSGDLSELERARQELIFTVPELRVRLLESFASTVSVLSDAVARRTGRASDDPQVRMWSGAAIGALLAVISEAATADGFQGVDLRSPDLVERVDAALAYLEAGLPL